MHTHDTIAQFFRPVPVALIRQTILPNVPFCRRHESTPSATLGLLVVFVRVGDLRRDDPLYCKPGIRTPPLFPAVKPDACRHLRDETARGGQAKIPTRPYITRLEVRHTPIEAATDGNTH